MLVQAQELPIGLSGLYMVAEYQGTLLAHPVTQEWYDAALKETEAHAHYDELAKKYGGDR